MPETAKSHGQPTKEVAPVVNFSILSRLKFMSLNACSGLLQVKCLLYREISRSLYKRSLELKEADNPLIMHFWYGVSSTNWTLKVSRNNLVQPIEKLYTGSSYWNLLELQLGCTVPFFNLYRLMRKSRVVKINDDLHWLGIWVIALLRTLPK